MSAVFVPLGSICVQDRKTADPTDQSAAALPYVGVEHVVSNSGVLALETSSRIGEGKSTTFRFTAEHVLYAKLRPYLNKVATPDFEGRCSTELVPLRPKPGVDREFLAHLLRRKATVDFVMASVTGARMPRTDMGVLMSMPVPLPPLDEQRRIVDILNRAERIRRLRDAAAATRSALIPALFLKMFGDSRTMAERYPARPLGEVADIGSGVTKGRKLDDADTVEVPYLRVANVQDGHLDLSEMKTIPIRETERDKYGLRPGDIVMTEGGDADKLGRGAIWTGALPYCAHQNHVFRVRPHDGVVLNPFLKELIGSHYGKAYFLSVAKQTTGIASINKTQLSAFPVPLPSLLEQQRFANLAASAMSSEALADTAARTSADLAAALTSRLFGEAA